MSASPGSAPPQGTEERGEDLSGSPLPVSSGVDGDALRDIPKGTGRGRGAVAVPPLVQMFFHLII